MLDFEFFENKIFFQKKFLLQNSFLSDVDYICTVFFLFWFILGGGLGELRLSHFSEIFDFFY